MKFSCDSVRQLTITLSSCMTRRRDLGCWEKVAPESAATARVKSGPWALLTWTDSSGRTYIPYLSSELAVPWWNLGGRQLAKEKWNSRSPRARIREQCSSGPPTLWLLSIHIHPSTPIYLPYNDTLFSVLPQRCFFLSSSAKFQQSCGPSLAAIKCSSNST